MAIRCRFVYPSGANLGVTVECLKSQLFWDGTKFSPPVASSSTGTPTPAAPLMIPLKELPAPHVGVYAAMIDPTPPGVFIDGPYVCYLHDLTSGRVVEVSDTFEMFQGTDFPPSLQPKTLTITGSSTGMSGTYY